MKKRFIKSTVAIILAIVAVFTCSGAVTQPRWKYVSTISGDINISALGIATVSGEGSAASTQVTKTVCKLHLQQLKNQKWTTIKTWSATSNMRYAAVTSKHWAVDRGYSYRIYNILTFVFELKYRIPMNVTKSMSFYSFGRYSSYPICPRCKITVEREYMAFCSRCGQKLDW